MRQAVRAETSAAGITQRRVSVTGQYYAFDHLDGGLLLWPRTNERVSRIEVDLGGKRFHLHR